MPSSNPNDHKIVGGAFDHVELPWFDFVSPTGAIAAEEEEVPVAGASIVLI
jgi:hypothetical protein